MNDYDFSALNDKEFEVLSTDILSKVEGTQIDRFKQGRDQGIDGKFFSTIDKPVIIQVKHWINSGIKQLLNHCEREEKQKVGKLNPSRYIFVCSLPLNNNDKKKLSNIFSPYLHEQDIYGKEKLNDYLKLPDFKYIEKNHYKLWLSSSHVLSLILNSGIYTKSDHSLEEIQRKSKYYIKTDNHDKAFALLEDTNCLIVSGEPGAGKTTLAESLCFQYFQQGYQFFEVEKEIGEAWDIFQKEQKQLFYFDDFLGRNYLDSLENNEDSQIVKFIQAVKSSNDKKFILTSRSSILKQGKQLSEYFKIPNVYKNEYELNISKLTELDKAQILYNHLYFSELPTEHIDQYYHQKRYRQIINHRNFNPRLISFITDHQRYNELNPEQYWEKINQQLSRPKDIWEFVFKQQVNDRQRTIVWLVTLKNGRISVNDLKNSLKSYCIISNEKFNTLQFDNDIEILTGSLLNRLINNNNEIYFDLFNPSIADYVIPKISNDSDDLANLLFSLNDIKALKNFNSYLKNNIVNGETYKEVIEKILYLIDLSNSTDKYFELFIQTLHDQKKYNHKTEISTKHKNFFIEQLNSTGFDIRNLSEGLLLLAELTYENDENCKKVNWDKLIISSLNHFPDHYELIEISNLITYAEKYTDTDFTTEFEEAARHYWQDQAHEEINDSVASDLSFDELDSLSGKTEDHLWDRFSEYQVDIFDIVGEMAGCVDTDSIKQSVLESYRDDNYYYRDSYSQKRKYINPHIDDIDQLFER